VLSKINTTLILLTELYGCFTWSDALREEFNNNNNNNNNNKLQLGSQPVAVAISHVHKN
jgi:hypothetical protein